ncbi:N-sulphoglucosamine sulphohydrolase isoform X1 [Halyomorpha halys]|uniref:N-sulphoglucosamine sulphohydrolase isoform X1 n=2 Tax=Halyomorpha halys TaxID=286706 RepID=UPI0006D50FFC|nr:N-sulphoglucosamine sulphohydrolase isoform X1 [Halyomorpha halys]
MFSWNIVTIVFNLTLFRYVLAKNVLVLVVDDGGFEIGAYGNNVVKTPNIDLLAAKGLLFNKAFTSVSSCSPSRASILTGLPTHQNGMYGLHHGIHNFNSLRNIKSLPTILSNEGIKTGIIGKKHVGPEEVFPFDFSETEENNSILQVGRNITKIKHLVRNFFEMTKNSPFLLYVGFHDPHRCGHSNPKYGNFCEQFGNGKPGMGLIPDWTPMIYKQDDVIVPYHIQDTQIAREDIASQYTVISRVDTGIGLILNELSVAGLENETLIIFTSDNGIPFPAGRTNAYDSGISVPMIISSPDQNASKNKKTTNLASLLDITPTILDWFDIHSNDIFHSKFTGKSLLPLLNGEVNSEQKAVFVSHNLHEVTMYYPMRAVRTNKYKLIHNLNYRMPFPIDQDFYISPTFQELLNNTRLKRPTHWYRRLEDYYYRQEWELFDISADPEEKHNIIHDPSHNVTMRKLKRVLEKWQMKTKDPWVCGTTHVLENATCLPLYNL